MRQAIMTTPNRMLAAILLLMISIVVTTTTRGWARSQVEGLDLAGVQNSVRADAHLTVHDDCAQALTFEKVEALAEKGAFRGHGHMAPGFGYSTCAYWLRLVLRDSGSTAADWILTLENLRINVVDFYERKPSGVEVFHAGNDRQIASRPIQSRYSAFPLQKLSPDTRTVYLRVLTTDVATFPVSVSRNEAFFRRNQRDEMVLGFYFGILLFSALLNGFAYVHLKDGTYLACLFCLASYALYQAARNAFGVEFLWPHHSAWNAVAIPLFGGASLASFSLFTWRFLSVGECVPMLRPLLHLQLALGGLISTLALMGKPSLGGLVTSYSSPVTALGICAMCVASAYSGFPQAKYFFMAGSLQFVGIFLDGLRNFSFLPTNFLTDFGDQIGSALFACISTLALTARFDTIQRNQVAAERIAVEFSRETAEARLQALQARINPHFLFNTLTTIAGLIREAPERAEAVVLKLAKLFRYTLAATGQTSSVQLTEELSIVRAYLEIEQARFGERLDFSIETEGDIGMVMLPGLILQPLVENSIKHGLRPKIHGGHVRVGVAVGQYRCQLIVADNGIGMDVNADHAGHGLASVRERLQLAYGGAAQMRLTNCNGLCVEIDLPLRCSL